MRTSTLCVALVALALLSLGAAPGRVLDRVPEKPNLAGRYVIYLHGRIIENEGRRPTSPAWGVYEYDQVLARLASEGATVISEQRKRDTDSDAFAVHVSDQVRQLLAAGVAAARVTVVGFSKGGDIATRVSSLLQNPQINFVFLAACGSGDFSASPLKVNGRMLSIVEASDETSRSCAQLFAKPGVRGEHHEIEIRIGGSHGAFFRPNDAWIAPLLQWVEGV
jgi:hypothetical protein